jgi:hypothetical protein
MEAVQYVLVAVPLCHPGDVICYETQHQHMDRPRQRCVDVHSENSVRKSNIFGKNNKYKHSQKSVC